MWAQAAKPSTAASSVTAEPAIASEKKDPDWTEPEPSAAKRGKGAQAWATTVPSSPGAPIDRAAEDSQPAAAPKARGAEDVWTDSVAGEPAPEPDADVTTAAPLTDPPKAVAADALKSTWPPRAEAGPAPPEETDIWPPEPPTEHAMPAWPPPSELAARRRDVRAVQQPGASAGPAQAPPRPNDEPSTPAQAIPSWPESFDSSPASTDSGSQPAGLKDAAGAKAAGSAAPEVAPPVPPAKQSRPAATVKPEPPSPGPAEPAAPTGPVLASEPPPSRVDTTPPTEPETIPPAEPVAPAAAAVPSSPAPARPAWAPGQGPSDARPSAEPPSRQTGGPEFQMPAWAPRVPLAAEPGTPTWFSPKEQIPHTTSQPIANTAVPQAPPTPAEPVVGGQLPVAQIPPAVAPAPRATAAAAGGPSQPPAGAKPTWQVVDQAQPKKAATGPTAEDRSYAEWFAWAKRGGAPASACHAAAQGAFKALSSGKDVSTAVQWATAAMSRPPENVSYSRQQYCAWFALANIDLNLDQPRSHAFAGAAVQALDAGADASAAHAAGLAGAGIR